MTHSRTRRFAIGALSLALLTACGSTDSGSEPDATTAPAQTADASSGSDAPLDTPATSEDDDAAKAEASPATTETVVEASADYDPTTWPLKPGNAVLPATFVDASGDEVTVESTDRIGSMSGAVSELLWTLGLGDQIVVIEGTTGYPEELTALPNVGFFRSLPAEGILAQSPDVLFVPLDAGPPEALDAIEAAGVPVVRVPIATEDPSSLVALTDTVGAAIGSPESALTLAASTLDAYKEVSLDVSADAPVVAYAVARGPNVFLTGLNSPSNTLIAAAGYRTAAGELGLAEASPLTPEALVAADPAVVVTTRTSVEQAGGEDAFLGLAGVAETTAGRNGALIVWDDDQSIQGWTPRSPQTVEQLVTLIGNQV